MTYGVINSQKFTIYYIWKQEVLGRFGYPTLKAGQVFPLFPCFFLVINANLETNHHAMTWCKKIACVHGLKKAIISMKNPCSKIKQEMILTLRQAKLLHENLGRKIKIAESLTY